VKKIDTIRSGGILRHYRTFVEAITTIYPDYPWQIWKFRQVPKGFWDNEDTVKHYLNWLTHHLGIRRLSEWKYVTSDTLIKLRAHSLLLKNGGLIPLLSKYYPEQIWWDDSTEKRYRSKSQAYLQMILMDIFPTLEIRNDYKHPSLVFPRSHLEMQLDIFIPKLDLAIEYQGQQHYNYHYLFGSPEDQKKRDRLVLISH
jgi:hypothetical protein